MKFEHTETWGFEHAIRGMRNPKESWHLSDSRKSDNGYYFSVGPKDLELMKTLIKAGPEHRKFMRQIFVAVDITAPLYWWKEFDTYKVGTTADSTSTMHKLAATPITIDCFEHRSKYSNEYEQLEVQEKDGLHYMYLKTIFEQNIKYLEFIRHKYNETKDKELWQYLIENLPESWLQTRTVTMNYENLLAMCRQRRNHKLTEWSQAFISWARTLPYAQEVIFIDEVAE